VIEYEWGLLPPVSEFENMRVDVVVIGNASDVRDAVSSFEVSQANDKWEKKFNVQRSMSTTPDSFASIERRAGVKIMLSQTSETKQTAKVRGDILGPYLRVLYADRLLSIAQKLAVYDGMLRRDPVKTREQSPVEPMDFVLREARAFTKAGDHAGLLALVKEARQIVGSEGHLPRELYDLQLFFLRWVACLECARGGGGGHLLLSHRER
jgi:hypothetical protein